ncbi:MAG TPA: GAF domain-containing protein, partial [Phycisphaerae bacterium]|nr:GAF domain-containing protein [Phycisphaerae bacterium]
MNGTATRPKILLLSKPGSRGSALLARLGEEAQVRIVDSFSDAMNALRDGHYDLIVSDQSDFMALERNIVEQQATMILNTIGQGVCIVDLDGRVIWSNPKMQSFPEELIKQISDCCARTTSQFSKEPGRPAHARARRFSLTASADQYFEVTLTPIIDDVTEELTQFTAVVWEVTHSRRLQKKLDAIDLAGRELVQLDAQTLSTMDVEDRIALLEQKILRYMRDLLHFDNFAVLLIDKKTNRLEIVLQHGMCPKSQDLDMFASAEDNGISGFVAATGRSYICHDTSKDPRYLQGLECAKSSLTVPLRLNDKVIGVFDIESDKLAAFNEDDRQFAEILGRSIALALHMLDLLTIERYEVRGRVADDVLDEISGPLNDIITEASTLKDEFIGHDTLRHGLNNIIDNISKIKATVKDVVRPKGLLGRQGDTGECDPVLSNKRILVADDEEIIRETVAGVLKKCGCVVDTAADG